MSQTSRFTRARRLTSTVLPGRRLDGYADQVTGRLRRIAAARSTGMLPFSGRSDGSIYFRDGKVAFAESTRTPGPAPHDPPAPDQLPLNKITAILAIAEPTVDAALELLSVQSRCAKFRPSKIPDIGPVSDISLDALLTEVARRQRVLGQRSVALSTDTALARNPHIRPDTIAHATAHCSRLSTAEAAPRSRSRTGVVRATLKRAIRSAFLITSASTKSTHRLENASAQC
jgi:hypothetical protein